ncbi:DUF5681 domain-containing protein [Dokdonella fugitiva]|uniref:DUF5681 domain-containing protein n=1 Tax=Dokdonella fugitiva TaxID=328517 RepID=A0A4R2ICW4_9GAMM|nr:DUF5681 domain-containing protein [Dokdonella fugitiva]TCO40435.1 hypothetical protein EV148_105230 [Dokdonella fugitiva]
MAERGRPFKPGQSGNPKGRPRGIVDKRSRIRQAFDGAMPDVLQALLHRARNGDVAAIALVLSRVAPPLRATREPIVVESAANATTPAEAAQALVRAAAAGELAPDVAAELIAALRGCSDIRQADEIERRLAELEGNADAS